MDGLAPRLSSVEGLEREFAEGKVGGERGERKRGPRGRGERGAKAGA